VRVSAYIALESDSYTALFIGVIDPTRTGVAYGTELVVVFVFVFVVVVLVVLEVVVVVVGGPDPCVGGALLPGLFAPLPPPPPAQADNRKTVDTAMAIALRLRIRGFCILAPYFIIYCYYKRSINF
jgi:hypothetical protein